MCTLTVHRPSPGTGAVTVRQARCHVSRHGHVRDKRSCEGWEDGARTDDSKNQFEWWYFDAELEDGSLVVAYFYKVHFLKDQFFIGFNYTSPQGEDFFQLKYFDKNEVSFLKDSCDVRMKNNIFKGNLSEYKIHSFHKDFTQISPRFARVKL